MRNLMTVEGDSSERRSFGDIDSAVEYISSRPHENFTIYDATIDVVNEIKNRVSNIISKG